MRRMIPFKINNQKTVISLLAVGVGATLIGVAYRRRLNGNAWSRMLRSIR